MENIFEGAKFGDRFITKSGKLAIFSTFSLYYNVYYLIVDGFNCVVNYLSNGKRCNSCDDTNDIISRYTKPIDEEDLFNEIDKVYDSDYSKGEYCHKQSFSWGFQEGYYKAIKGE